LFFTDVNLLHVSTIYIYLQLMLFTTWKNKVWYFLNPIIDDDDDNDDNGYDDDDDDDDGYDDDDDDRERSNHEITCTSIKI